MNHTKNLKKLLMQRCWKFSGDYDIQSVSEISDNDSLSSVDKDDACVYIGIRAEFVVYASNTVVIITDY